MAVSRRLPSSSSATAILVVRRRDHPSSSSARASEAGGMQGIWHPNCLCGRHWYVYPPRKT